MKNERKGYWKTTADAHYCSECGFGIMDDTEVVSDFNRENPERWNGYIGWHNFRNYMNYCPNCGARMTNG